jgi:hypothetical protein
MMLRCGMRPTKPQTTTNHLLSLFATCMFHDVSLRHAPHMEE